MKSALTKFALVTATVLATSSSYAADLLNCNDGNGYIQTMTQVWQNPTSGQWMAYVGVHDIENPGDYRANYKNVSLVENADGTMTISSRVKGRYLLEVSADKKSAKLTATNVDPVTVYCK